MLIRYHSYSFDDANTGKYSSKDGVLSVEPRVRSQGNEKLRTIRIGATRKLERLLTGSSKVDSTHWPLIECLPRCDGDRDGFHLQT